MAKARSRILTRAEVGLFFGRSLPTVDTWVNEGCPIHGQSGGKGQAYEFDSAEVSDWLIQRAVEKQVGKAATIDIGQVRKRKMEAEAQIAELNYKKARGEMIPLEIVKASGAEAFAACKTRLLQLKRIIKEVRGAKTLVEAERIFVRAVLEALTELGNYCGSETGTTESVDGGVKASTEAQDQRVGGSV